MKIRTLFIAAFISIFLLYVACVQSPEQVPLKPGGTAQKQSIDQKKTVRVKHLSGEVLAVNARTKTITVRFKDEDVFLTFDDSTVVKIDLDSMKPSEIPLGARATVKYIERKGQHIAKGIFISTETAEKKRGVPPIILPQFCETRCPYIGESPSLQRVRMPSFRFLLRSRASDSVYFVL